MDHLSAINLARDELDAWGEYEHSESWIEHFPEAIEGDKIPAISPHSLWLAIVELQDFYPKRRLPKLTGALDAWSNLLKYSRQHGSEDRIVQRDMAIANARILREWLCSEIERISGDMKGSASMTSQIAAGKDEIPDIDRVTDPLTVLQTRIIHFLWKRAHATNFDSLAQSCWPNGSASDETIVKRLKDIEKRWGEKGDSDQWYVQLDLEISPGKRTVKLIRPGQNKGQK